MQTVFKRTVMANPVLAAVLLTAALLGGCGGGDALSADAGDDFTVAIGESPTFDACDSKGAIINYAWKILKAPPSMADDAGKMIAEESADCSFTLEASMIAEEVGRWVIQLTVVDASGSTSTDTVTVDVE